MNDIITSREFRDAGYCVKGQRRVLATTDIDFKDFVRNGLTVEKALATPQIRAATEDVLKRRKQGG